MILVKNKRRNEVKRFSILVGCLLLGFGAHVAAEQGSTVLTGVPDGQENSTQTPSLKVFKYTNKSGVQSYSDRAPAGVKYTIFQFSCFACNPKSTVNWSNIPLQLKAYQYAIDDAAKMYRVDPALVRAVIHAESAFRPGARSEKGALGLMQLMPDTAKDMGVANPLVPEDNIRGGVRYLAWLLEENSGNTMLATAAYNAGPGAVKRHNGIPPYEETQTYVKRVKILHDRYKKALNKTFSGRWVSQAGT
jgi:soluble lytic murein transglycosylase-like protein